MNECILEKPLAGKRGPLFCGYPSQTQPSGHPKAIPSLPRFIYAKDLESKHCLALTAAAKGRAETPADTA